MPLPWPLPAEGDLAFAVETFRGDEIWPSDKCGAVLLGPPFPTPAAAPTPAALPAPVPTSGPAFPSDPAGDGPVIPTDQRTNTSDDEKVNYVEGEEGLGQLEVIRTQETIILL